MSFALREGGVGRIPPVFREQDSADECGVGCGERLCVGRSGDVERHDQQGAERDASHAG
jgi:hypothetical protein